LDGREVAGDGGDGLEARVAVLETHIEHIRKDIGMIQADIRDLRDSMHAGFGGLRLEARTDFRLLFGALIGVALGLAGLMARGFGWL
jgi:hypothetical protein